MKMSNFLIGTAFFVIVFGRSGSELVMTAAVLGAFTTLFMGVYLYTQGM